jgi:hypothetical protein
MKRSPLKLIASTDWLHRRQPTGGEARIGASDGIKGIKEGIKGTGEKG